MSCGVLVVSPDSHVEAQLAGGESAATGAARLGQGLAEVLRSAGHSVVECDPPGDDGRARGAVEAAWVVLAGVDLVVIVEDPAEPGHPTGPLCDRARELMTDRGPGGAIVWVPPGVSEGTAAACLLELADLTEAEGLAVDGVIVAARPLEVEPVGPRATRSDRGTESEHGTGEHGTGEHGAEFPPAWSAGALRRPAAGGEQPWRTVPEGLRGGRS